MPVRGLTGIWASKTSGLVALAVLALGSLLILRPAPALANTVTGTVTLSGGTLSLITPPILEWGENSDGYDHVLGEAGTYEVTDATGTGAGWHVTSTYNGFTNVLNSVSLPNTALTTNGSNTTYSASTPPPASCVSTCTLPSPSGSVVYPVTVQANNATVVYSASAGSGVGTADLAAMWWLSIPANVGVGTFFTTVTMNVGSGP